MATHCTTKSPPKTKTVTLSKTLFQFLSVFENLMRIGSTICYLNIPLHSCLQHAVQKFDE